MSHVILHEETKKLESRSKPAFGLSTQCHVPTINLLLLHHLHHPSSNHPVLIMKAVIVALVVLFACICVAQASVTDLTEDSFASSIKQGKWLVKLYVKQPHTGVECE
jgi:hypothetical protein